MSNSIFPLISPKLDSSAPSGKALYREVKWDFEKNRPVYRNGEPVIMEGAEAVLTWAWNALQVERYRFEVLSRSYGCEINTLIGQPYTDELKHAEIIRYVKECLMVNPYISGIEDVEVSFDSPTLQISFRLNTFYGEVSGNVTL